MNVDMSLGPILFYWGFKTNLLTETSFPRPAYKNLLPFCLWQYYSIGRATSGVKLVLGCWFGSLTITYQEHPSPLICLVYTSSFFRPQQECLCGTFLILPGRGYLFFPVLAVQSTVLYVYTCCITHVLFASNTISFVILWTSGGERQSLISLFPLFQAQWLVQSREIAQWIFLKECLLK